MTNGDWIRSMTDEELEEKVLNVCNNFSCTVCHMKNFRGKCVLSTDKGITLEWLESERRND